MRRAAGLLIFAAMVVAACAARRVTPEVGCKPMHQISDYIVKQRDMGVPEDTVRDELRRNSAKSLEEHPYDPNWTASAAASIATMEGAISYAYANPNASAYVVGAVSYYECVKAHTR